MSADRDAAWILTLRCRDQVGIVAAVTSALAAHAGFILSSQQYADIETGSFFMRIEFARGGDGFPNDRQELVDVLEPLANDYGMDWSLSRADEKPAVVLAVSKGSHCLSDLLYRQQSGSLAAKIVAVVSNHDSMRELVEWHGIDFHYLPVDNGNRAEQEQAIEAVMAATGASYLVLARYMQVLTEAFSRRLDGRCINIHHSFLPGFKGADPYRRAFERGVKLIGATAHFVTADLDEGPIIAQAVEPVDHSDSAQDMIRIGRDIEARVLARAVNALGERRLFPNGRKTVVF